jgi:hypothetical protein
VQYNRSGESDAVVTLTERELHLLSNNKENSGISLQLEVNRGDNQWTEASPWLDQRKLAEIGFDCRMPADAKDAALRYNRELPRRTYVALEYQGKAWEDRLAGLKEKLRVLESRTAEGSEKKKSLEAERKRLRWEMESDSRLFVIDAGNDAATLRTRYPDRTKYIITPAKVRLRLIPANSAQKRQQPVLSGYVDEILTDTIHVPRERLGVLASLKPDAQYFYYDGMKENFTPRYRVMLKYGRRHEPWVAEVARF